MNLPAPIRKIPRELLRIGHQADDLLYRLSGWSFFDTYSRIAVEPRVRHVPGALIRGKKVAIYLIFPKDGLLRSHLIALRHIVQSGYTPVVVSNLPLKPDEMAAVLPNCSTLILRPNFGYDFGGYKDAIRFLDPDLQDMDYLALFNDSSWFPLRPDTDWLAEAEATALDFVGTASHGGIDPAQSFADEGFEWKIDRTRPRFHYCSAAILIGAAILHSEGFRTFWRSYRLSNSKKYTIIRGEIGLSQWVISQNFTHGETLDARRLPELLANLPTARLLQIAQNAITFDRQRPGYKPPAVLQATPPNHKDLLHFILREVLKSGQVYSLQDFDSRERNGNFIKKLPISVSRTAAVQTLRILSQLDGPNVEVFRSEAMTLYARKYGQGK